MAFREFTSPGLYIFWMGLLHKRMGFIKLGLHPTGTSGSRTRWYNVFVELTLKLFDLSYTRRKDHQHRRC